MNPHLSFEYNALLRRISSLVFVMFCFGSFLAHANAENILEVRPAVIDLRGKARDIFKESVEVTNNSDRKRMFYAFVYNIENEEGRQAFADPSVADQARSLANWISISRGVIELDPEGGETLPLEITVNLRAIPDRYHAAIVFAEGSSREEAEKNVDSSPRVLINLEVFEEIKEQLSLKRFVSEKNFGRPPIGFVASLENTGNRPLTPRGEIRLYKRNGAEAAAFPVNPNHSIIAPGDSGDIRSVFEGKLGLGRYKAFLDLTYGDHEEKRLQDTYFFWVFPWGTVVVLFALFFVGLWLFARLIHRGTRGGHHVPAPPRREPHPLPSRHYMHDIVDLRDIEKSKTVRKKK